MTAYYPPNACRGSPTLALVEDIIQKTSGSLSIIGSAEIVADVVARLLRGGGRTDSYQRIMLLLSFYDMLHSFFDSLMGTWMVPSETGWHMAVGNRESCTASGFFAALGYFGAMGYQMALSFNILVLISFGWTQQKFAQKVELPVHIGAVLISLAYAIPGIPLELYNADCGQCLWVPVLDEGGNVLRGSVEAGELYWTFFFVYMWITIAFCTFAMFKVYFSVRKQEDRMKRYDVPGDEADRHRESKRIRKILGLYTVALYVCWGIPFSIHWVAKLVTGELYGGRPWWVVTIGELFIPLLGFFNMLVYFLPKCLKYQQNHPGMWLVTSYCHVLGVGRCFRRCCIRVRRVRRSLFFGRADDDEDEEELSETDSFDDADMNFRKFNSTLTVPVPRRSTSQPDNSPEEE